MMHYIKFSLFHVLTLITIAALFFAQHWIVYGYVTITFFIIAGDALLGDDTTIPGYRNKWLLDVQLFIALPLLFILLFISLWHISSQDPLGFGQFLQSTFGYDLFLARENTHTWHHVVAIFFVGLMVSTIGTVTGHELVHRTYSPGSVTVGRWLLAFSFDANFSVEHVYGHHRYVATAEDPATAPRGRNVYQHIVLSTIKGNISAWNIEKQRLIRKGQNVVSHHNVCLRGYLMSIVLLLLSYTIAQWAGVLFFTLSALWAKAMLEIVNYMEHYGMVRNPKKRVEPRHSWNTNKKISSWAMFNLSRHSHHHAHGQLPYHQLKPYPQAPTMISGYLATIFITMIPPLWFKLMKPKLKEWDEKYANDEEKALLNHQLSNSNS
ncbi:MAG: hypothetical protein Alis3KO_03020 [Aliiglaciecola sp.]